MFSLFLALVGQEWSEEKPVSFESLVLVLVILGVAGFFLKKWSNYCDRAFEKEAKLGMAMFLSPFAALTAYWSYQITSQSRFPIGGSPAISFVIWFVILGIIVAIWLAIISAISEMFK